MVRYLWLYLHMNALCYVYKEVNALRPTITLQMEPVSCFLPHVYKQAKTRAWRTQSSVELTASSASNGWIIMNGCQQMNEGWWPKSVATASREWWQEWFMVENITHLIIIHVMTNVFALMAHWQLRVPVGSYVKYFVWEKVVQWHSCHIQQVTFSQLVLWQYQICYNIKVVTLLQLRCRQIMFLDVLLQVGIP